MQQNVINNPWVKSLTGFFWDLHSIWHHPTYRNSFWFRKQSMLLSKFLDFFHWAFIYGGWFVLFLNFREWKATTQPVPRWNTGEVDWSAAIPVFWGDARTEPDECCYMGYFQNGPTCSDWLLHGLFLSKSIKHILGIWLINIDQRKFSLNTSELRTIVMGSILTMMIIGYNMI